jgi:uncharacterized protein YecT (DUF1311 family)
VIVALLLAAALAQPTLDDPVETACYAADYSQQAMNRCAGEAFERADKALNAEWAKVMGGDKGDAEADKLMLEAQRAWIKYRDAHCEAAAYDSKGGSIWPLLVSSCRAELTRRRTRELVAMREGEGN